MNGKINYAIYTRKSTEGEDRQVQSLDAQLRELQEIAKKNKLNVDKKIFRESKSAKRPHQRPDFAELISMIVSGKVQGIICWEISRLTRNPTDSGTIQQLLQDGKLLEIRTYTRTYKPEDNAVIFSVEASISNQFIIDLRKNVKRGIREKVRKGGLPGPAPEGYLNNRLKKTIKKDPIRFPLIRKVFDLYLTGNYSVSELRVMLDDWGYRTVKHPKSGGKPIARSTIYHILTNPRYSGQIPDPDDEDVIHRANFPAMITPDEFSKVQILLGRKGRTKYVTKKHFELKGLLKCGECGCFITAERKAKRLVNGGVNLHTYYHCTKKKPCSQKAIREDDLFVQLNELLDKFEIIPKLYDWGLKAIEDIAKEEVGQRDDAQRMQFATIDETQKTLDRLVDLVTRGVISEKDYKAQTKGYKKELALRQNEQKETAERARNWYEIIGKTLELLNGANEQFAKGGFGERRDILLAIGYNPILIDNKVQITPNEWLIPIQRELPALKASLAKVITEPDKIGKASEEAVLSHWYPGLELNQRP